MFVKFNAMNDAIKILVSALVIVLVNEASKRSTTLAAILLALPSICAAVTAVLFAATQYLLQRFS